MGFLKRLFSKGGEKPELSPGGSRLYRYQGGEFSRTPRGITDGPTMRFASQREEAYREVLGECSNVYHETLNFIPHVDVFTFDPTPDRPFYTLITSGMSDIRMTLPKGVRRELSRAELVFYIREPEQLYLELMRRLAHFPHDNATWLSYDHTMPNGNPPSPLVEDSVLDTMLFAPSIVSPDCELHRKVSLEGDPLNLLWLVPISTRECDLKLEKGVGSLYDLVESVRHPAVFDPQRGSYA